METESKCICIGINYKNKPCKLNGCINDCEFMISFLKSKGHTNIQKMTDEMSGDNYPSKENIIKVIQHVNTPTLILTYAGHGVEEPSEIAFKKDQCLVCADMQYLSDKDILKLLKTNDNIKRVITVFDCCHSGSMIDLKYKINFNLKLIENNGYYESCADEVVIKSVQSCEDNEVSAEFGTSGILTMALMQLNKEGIITTKNILTSTQKLSKQQHSSVTSSLPFKEGDLESDFFNIQ